MRAPTTSPGPSRERSDHEVVVEDFGFPRREPELVVVGAEQGRVVLVFEHLLAVEVEPERLAVAALHAPWIGLIFGPAGAQCFARPFMFMGARGGGEGVVPTADDDDV